MTRRETRDKYSHSDYGTEILFDSISGRCKPKDPSHHIKVIDNLEDMTLKGKYMAVTLLRLLVNVRIESEYDGRVRRFTLLQVSFHNLWDYRLTTTASGSVKMIDSEGFQHDGDGCDYHEFCLVSLPGNEGPVEVSFPWPELTLEDHARTNGWIWFAELADGVLPKRFVFRFDVFEPGSTSGWVKDSETLEFVVTSYRENAIKQIPAQ